MSIPVPEFTEHKEHKGTTGDKKVLRKLKGESKSLKLESLRVLRVSVVFFVLRILN